jgi:hypothetical protein
VEGGSANDYDYCSGDPVNCNDLDGTLAYNYTFDLGTRGTPEELAAFAIANCGDVFPISGCSSGFQEGDELRLQAKFLRFYTQSFPVRVLKVTPTSFTFITLKGHLEGEGRTITFEFYRENGRNKLTAYTSNTGSAAVNYPISNNLSFFFARRYWRQFASNIRGAF